MSKTKWRLQGQLDRACYMGNVEVVKQLATVKNADLPNAYGTTPLQTAMLGMHNIEPSERYMTIAMILIDKGADPYATGTFGCAHDICRRSSDMLAGTMDYYYGKVHEIGDKHLIPYITDRETWRMAYPEVLKAAHEEKKQRTVFRDIEGLLAIWRHEMRQYGRS